MRVRERTDSETNQIHKHFLPMLGHLTYVARVCKLCLFIYLLFLVILSNRKHIFFLRLPSEKECA